MTRPVITGMLLLVAILLPQEKKDSKSPNSTKSPIFVGRSTVPPGLLSPGKCHTIMSKAPGIDQFDKVALGDIDPLEMWDKTLPFILLPITKKDSLKLLACNMGTVPMSLKRPIHLEWKVYKGDIPK